MRFLPKRWRFSWWTIYLGFGFLYFSLFWSRAIWFDVAGNVVAGHVNILGDWAAHFTMGSKFAYTSLTDMASPFIINARLSYPFVVNWITAVLIKLGIPFLSAYVFLSWLGSLAIVVAVGSFYRQWFKSTGLAVLASLIFFCNGGLGFMWFLTDVASAPNPLSTFLNPPHEYTRLDAENIKWISVIDSMIIPQRAFTLGFPFALLILVGIWKLENAIHLKTSGLNSWRSQKFHRLGLGIGLGLLPIIHMHSFLALVIILSCWGLATIPATWAARKTWLWRWLMIAVPALLLAIPLYIWFFASHTSNNFISWYPGWLATQFKENWGWWWLKNWGLTPMLAVIGSGYWIFRRQTGRRSRAVWIAPFWILFLALNLILFQPFSWDNTKLLVWTSLGFSGLAAYGLNHWWLRWKKPTVGFLSLIFKQLKLASISLIFLVVIASGAIDAYWDLRVDLHNYIMYSEEEWELASWVRDNTQADSIWLTGDQHNHWLFNLTGRQTILAYRGWVWTHGYDYHRVENDVAEMLSQPTSNLELIKQYQISYIVLGPNELHDWHANKLGWTQIANPIKKTEHYTVYQLALPNNP